MQEQVTSSADISVTETDRRINPKLKAAARHEAKLSREGTENTGIVRESLNSVSDDDLKVLRMRRKTSVAELSSESSDPSAAVSKSQIRKSLRPSASSSKVASYRGPVPVAKNVDEENSLLGHFLSLTLFLFSLPLSLYYF